MHPVSVHWFYVFWETLKYTEAACSVRETMGPVLVAYLMENTVSLQETKETRKLLPNFYWQPSKNEHLHLIQIYKLKISVQFRMVYRFQIACVPENIQSIKKYQRAGDKRLSGSVQQKRGSLQQAEVREKVKSLDTRSTEGGRSQIRWWGIRCIVRPIFLWGERQTRTRGHKIAVTGNVTERVHSRWRSVCGVSGTGRGSAGPRPLEQLRWNRSGMAGRRERRSGHHCLIAVPLTEWSICWKPHQDFSFLTPLSSQNAMR